MSLPDTNSSDAVLRAYAPGFLADPYRMLANPAYDEATRLDAAWLFVEAAGALLFAILATEHAGLGEPTHRAVRDVLELPRGISAGSWVNGADAIALSLVGRGDLVAPEIAAVLRDAQGKETAACHALKRLSKARNDKVHSKLDVRLSDIDAPIRVVADALRVLRRYPLCVARDVERTKDRRWRATIVRFGAEKTTVELDEAQLDLLPHQAFVVGVTGEVLVLGPWIAVDQRKLEPATVMEIKGRELRYRGTDTVGLVGDLPTPAAQARWRAMEARCARTLADRTSPAPRIPGFRIERLLGEGASGAVWLACGEGTTGARVAVKVLHPALAAIEKQKQRLRAEYKLLDRLNHTNVVRVHYLQEDDQVGLYVVMEWIDGTHLGERVRPGGMPAEDALRIVRQVLDALAAAHREGIVHRDVKPSNVLVDAQGVARLIDFGIGWADDRSFRTGAYEVVGTLAFAAPEQIRGEAVDPRTDVFGAGRLLQFLLEGPKEDGVAAGNVPDELRAVIRRATQENPAHRYSSAEEMRRALDPGAVLPSPVRVGDRLEGYAVRAVQGRAAGGFWMLLGAELASGEPVGMLLASDETSRALLARVSGVPDEHRRQLGYRGRFETADGLCFAVVRPGDGPARLVALLTARPAASETLSTATVVGATAAAAAVAALGAAAGIAVTGGALANLGLMARRARAAQHKKGKK
jgi:hypothetical protein